MGIYQQLANFYDLLVKDEQATQDWVAFIEAHAQFQSVFECACGSGEITLALALKGYQVEASDLSQEMIQQAKQKAGAELVEFKVMDMSQFASEVKRDLVLCLCDSLNYLLLDSQIESFVQSSYDLLKPGGTLIFDVHSQDRLMEFQEEFLEEGTLGEIHYEWDIQSDDDRIYQNFVFFDQEANASYEQHIQRVFDAQWLMSVCEKVGFGCEIYTDFIHKGIHPGEKYFYVCHKGANI